MNNPASTYQCDTLVMGGGLAGYTAAIVHARRGERVTLLDGGPSMALYHPGTISLLSPIEGELIHHPLEALDRLPELHPYRKLGADGVLQRARAAQALLADIGITATGDVTTSRYCISPMGVIRATWLTLKGFASWPDPDHLPWERVLLVDIAGYLDFPTALVAHTLEQLGAHVETCTVTVGDPQRGYRTPAQMRPTSISRQLVTHNELAAVARQLEPALSSAHPQVILMPAVIGADDEFAQQRLQSLLPIELLLLPTLPPTVAGQRLLTTLRHYFMMMGGTVRAGESAVRALIDGDSVTGITTSQSSQPLTASHYVLATGGIGSGGLVAHRDDIVEPIMGADVNAPHGRAHWTASDALAPQPYMDYGILTDDAFHPLRAGIPLRNVTATGHILACSNPATHAPSGMPIILSVDFPRADQRGPART